MHYLMSICKMTANSEILGDKTLIHSGYTPYKLKA